MMPYISLPGRTAYSASKSALLGFNKALALELAGEKITVNGISPGVCDTEVNAPLTQNPALKAEFLAKIPVGRFGEALEIARLAVYLCSPDAGFSTGTDVVIDGGWTAQERDGTSSISELASALHRHKLLASRGSGAVSCVSQTAAVKARKTGSCLKSPTTRAGIGEWRKGWDLNPRNLLQFVRFRVECVRPLCHPSVEIPLWHLATRRQE